MSLMTDTARVAATAQALLDGRADPWAALPATARTILHAALESFSARGFHATTLKHIAAGSGLSTAALYVHFRSKDELLFAISRGGHEQALALVEAAAPLAPPEHALRVLVYAFVCWHAEHHTVARVVQYELDALGAEHRAQIAELRRATEQAVRGVVAGALGVDPAGPEVRGLGTAILSLGIDVARWFRPGGPYTPDGLARLYSDLAVRMLGPSAPDRTPQ